MKLGPVGVTLKGKNRRAGNFLLAVGTVAEHRLRVPGTET
jgi:hypothetical protein